MAREMQAGDPAATTVGASAAVVGRSNSNLMNMVTGTILAGVIVNQLTERGAPGLRPGDAMMNVLSGNVEVYSNKPNSALTKCVMGTCLLGFAAKLLDANTAPPPSQDQLRAEAFAKEDARIAQGHADEAKRLSFYASEDAHRQEEFAKEQARIAFFNKPPRM